jgi:hypothetical protein
MFYVQSLQTGGTIFWKELHSTVTTNSFGLFTLVVGTGTRQTESSVATFDLIDWSVSPKYLKTEIYYSGSWKDMGTSQVYSVPYALQAKNSEQWLTNGTNIYRPTGNVGIGTTIPLNKLDINGGLTVRGSIFTGGDKIEINQEASGNRNAYIDFHGDDVNSDFGLRLIRYNSGPDAISRLEQRGNGALEIWSGMLGPIDFYTNSTQRIHIGSDGNVGISTSAPKAVFEVNGSALIGNSSSGDRLYSYYIADNTLGIQTLLDGQLIGNYPYGGLANKLILQPSAGIVGIGTTNPTAMLHVAGLTRIQGDLTVDNNVGIGTAGSTSKMIIQPSSSWDDNIPLFEVKNKYGIPVLAVYNNGVRILVDHTSSKALKGGFAVGGYDATKSGKTVDFMIISPDSIRFSIDNSEAKAVKSGFAVGGYDMTKKGPINQDFMYITPQGSSNGQYNTFLGYQAGYHNQSVGLYNSFIGYNSGYNNLTGIYNVFLGYHSGYSNQNGSSNVFIGNSAGSSNTTGSNNLLIGYQSGYYVNQSSYNIMIGNDAGHWTNYMPPTGDQGSYNTFVGYMSGQTNSTGSYNSFYGYKAGYGKSPEGISGTNNVAMGSNSGFNIHTGSSNVFLGTNAGISTTEGSYNVYIGDNAGYANTNGNENIYIGRSAGGNSGTYHCSTPCYRYDPSIDFPVLGNWQWGDNNTCLGQFTGYKNKGSYNVFIGNSSGYNNAEGAGNLFLGWGAGYNNIVGEYNTYIGTAAGYKATGTGNVFIGARAGYAETGDDLLYIDNRSVHDPLIWGDFNNNLLKFNGKLGVQINPTHLIHLSGGAYSDGATWTNASDKNLKENFEPIDATEILTLIDKLPVTKWNYITDKPDIKHIGPVAQDFYSLFGLGNNDTSISTVDPSGVALIAIKELSKENKVMKEQIESFKSENDDLKFQLQSLQEEVEQIKRMLEKGDGR